jgi:hypothetical protein
MPGFFDPAVKEEVKTEEAQPEKVKIGDVEYDPKEVEELVGKGRFAKEIEEKYNTDLSKVWPEYTKSRQQLKEAQGKLSEYEQRQQQQEQQQIAQKSQQGQQLSQEELINLAEQQGFVTKSSINNYIQNYLQAKDLVDTGKSFEKDGNPYKASDLPKFNLQDTLDYMQQTGVKNPEDAYDLMYKKEIAEWREKEISKARGKGGLRTEASSSPGNKMPQPSKIDRNNLNSFVSSALSGEM